MYVSMYIYIHICVCWIILFEIGTVTVATNQKFPCAFSWVPETNEIFIVYTSFSTSTKINIKQENMFSKAFNIPFSMRHWTHPKDINMKKKKSKTAIEVNANDSNVRQNKNAYSYCLQILTVWNPNNSIASLE